MARKIDSSAPSSYSSQLDPDNIKFIRKELAALMLVTQANINIELCPANDAMFTSFKGIGHQIDIQKSVFRVYSEEIYKWLPPTSSMNRRYNISNIRTIAYAATDDNANRNTNAMCNSISELPMEIKVEIIEKIMTILTSYQKRLVNNEFNPKYWMNEPEFIKLVHRESKANTNATTIILDYAFASGLIEAIRDKRGANYPAIIVGISGKVATLHESVPNSLKELLSTHHFSRSRGIMVKVQNNGGEKKYYMMDYGIWCQTAVFYEAKDRDFDNINKDNDDIKIDNTDRTDPKRLSRTKKFEINLSLASVTPIETCHSIRFTSKAGMLLMSYQQLPMQHCSVERPKTFTLQFPVYGDYNSNNWSSKYYDTACKLFGVHLLSD